MKTGRPTLLTADFILRVEQRVAVGNYAETATIAEGASRSAYQLWCAKGATDIEAGRDDTPEAVFLAAVTRARAQAECSMVEALQTAETDSVVARALQWLLERTRRERFGQSIEIVAREKVQDDLLARLRTSLDQETFGRVVVALVGEGSDEVPDDEQPATH